MPWIVGNIIIFTGSLIFPRLASIYSLVDNNQTRGLQRMICVWWCQASCHSLYNTNDYAIVFLSLLYLFMNCQKSQQRRQLFNINKKKHNNNKITKGHYYIFIRKRHLVGMVRGRGSSKNNKKHASRQATYLFVCLPGSNKWAERLFSYYIIIITAFFCQGNNISFP